MLSFQYLLKQLLSYIFILSHTLFLPIIQVVFGPANMTKLHQIQFSQYLYFYYKKLATPGQFFFILKKIDPTCRPI